MKRPPRYDEVYFEGLGWLETLDESALPGEESALPGESAAPLDADAVRLLAKSRALRERIAREHGL